MKNKFLKSTIALSAFLLMFSCKEDDATGQSTLEPTSPLISVALDFNANQTFVENDSEHTFTVNLSEPQVVNVQVNVAQISGTATDGADFTIPHAITIPAGATSASGSIIIHSDELAEDTETAEISIGLGNEANADTTPQVVTFEIQNVTADDLVIDLSWMNTSVITDNNGNEISAEALADLEFLIVDTAIPFTTEYLVVDDAAGYETMVFSGAYPDGEYNLAARFFAAADYGTAYTNLDMALDFNQTGTINHQMVNVPAGLNTEFASCQTVILAKVTKAGTSYTIETVGLPNTLGPAQAGTFVGDYLIEELTPLVDGPTLDDGSIVTLYETSGNNRAFMSATFPNYCPTPAEFEFTLDPICGIITVPGEGYQIGCSCAGNYFLSTATNPDSFDANDDSVFEFTFTNDRYADCGGTTQTTYRFTKQ